MGFFVRLIVYYGIFWVYKWDKFYILYIVLRENYFLYIYYFFYNVDFWIFFWFVEFLWLWKCLILLFCLLIKKRMFSDENNFNILKCILVFLYDCYICIYMKIKNILVKRILCFIWNKFIVYCVFKIDL